VVTEVGQHVCPVYRHGTVAIPYIHVVKLDAAEDFAGLRVGMHMIDARAPVIYSQGVVIRVPFGKLGDFKLDFVLDSPFLRFLTCDGQFLLLFAYFADMLHAPFR
jgi:hypothetical protein